MRSRLSVDERAGVLDSLREDLVGELAVGESGGQLRRPGRHGEARRFCRERAANSRGARRAALSSAMAAAPSVCACLVPSVRRLAPSSRSAEEWSGAGTAHDLGRQAAANEVLKSLSAGPQRAALILRCALSL
ncbi:conserved hypothetical protein [Streptomyces sviceus ATCC 29083]|uniref:Uncharacterized protein n=1 Tax=Streptomyces sviceus (strain ATCC 29083 / DSM 924 / JCM 4929 / NBRC 13980 / NCIMB 11184 / NRRL 5439 / UC 5370) TaxID=463191 RepID=B5I3F6_STRX2|nr:conserved hypothetical protein [Streptomyces sviceus ATCC 29083]